MDDFSDFIFFHIFGCSILFLLILSAPDVNTNISNSNTEFLDCDSKSYAEVDFLRVDNIQTFLKALSRMKPASAKGNFLHSLYLSSTMGPGLKIQSKEIALS